MSITKVTNLIIPEVMAPMVSASLPKKIKFTAIAGLDTSLVGQAGDTITVPKYAYIGDAEDVAEGVAMGTTILTASTTKAKVKKAGKAIEITDEASIAAKIDNDCYEALKGASLKHDSVTKAISYEGIVDAVDKFDDENDEAIEKLIFVNPKQITQLRKDPNFLDINKYPITNGVVMSGMIGSIAGCKVVKSKKIGLNAESTAYLNPIVVVDVRDPNEEPNADGNAPDMPALTIYLKRDVQLETDRDILKKTTTISSDEHYSVVLSNDSKVVLASFKK